MKALLVVVALVLFAVFVVRQPDAESSGTAGRGTGTDDGGPLGSRCTVFADVPTMRDGQLIGPARFRCAKENGGVDVTVSLQIDEGKGRWVSVEQTPMGATGVDTTKKRSERERTAFATADCRPGTYRTFVGGTVSNDERSFRVEAVSDRVTVPCAGASSAPAKR
ncbi:hypothetical protein GCM10009557_18340 [Virgisporangium ochraceum]|jgi:hypothetical protein|uniref:Uncharacterized protein n=1 Tax=Virgisporangium ochraceum TaxID=65505 RepID=A0A8J3ZTJ2_9ACTN|nr:hypothetical protein [Virgisporangium ochraceum]GIJ69932.1 hypothetical protein Voc01_048490 [Virgisporangium ochraceum]